MNVVFKKKKKKWKTELTNEQGVGFDCFIWNKVYTDLLIVHGTDSLNSCLFLLHVRERNTRVRTSARVTMKLMQNQFNVRGKTKIFSNNFFFSFIWKEKKTRIDDTTSCRDNGQLLVTSSTKLDELLIFELRTLEGWLTTIGSLTLAKHFRRRKPNKRVLPKYQFIVPSWPNGILALGLEDLSKISRKCLFIAIVLFCNSRFR